MKTVFTILIVCSCFAWGYGLDADAFRLLDSPYTGGLGFQNLRSTASFSLISGPGGSWGQGAYVGTLHFALHPKVTALLDIGYARTFDFTRGGNFGHALGGFELVWKPSSGTAIQFQYSGILPTGPIEEGF